ncbi:MAG: cell envelope biogenesis protein TolA [Sphingosinicella sp.]
MDRAEATGLGIAVAGHAALLAGLSLGLTTLPSGLPAAFDVSFVEEIGLLSAAPRPAQTPPQQGQAPELGPAEDAARENQAEAPPTPPVAGALAAPARTAQSERPRRPLIGQELLEGIGADPSPSRSRDRPAAVMSRQAMADIGSAIIRQVQPCADQQVDPGPGANRIVTTINLRLNRDGSLAQRPRVVRQSGIDELNRRYADRVADLAIAAFVGCAPMRGLPPELYEVPRGWSNFTLNYRLPD